MIHANFEDEKREAKPIDFAWILFIGKNKLGFSTKEVGRLTWGAFSDMYAAYKDTFDIEMMLYKSNTKYSDLNKEITIDDVIPL